MPSAARHPALYQTYAERAEGENVTPLAVYLLRLIHYKRTNLCVSADVTTTTELLQLAEDIGDHICVLKTHADIIKDFGDKTIKGLNDVARRRQFLVFEDRKFGDIGNTVQQQYTGGPLTIVRWAPIVNAHLFPGPSIITALSQAAQRAISAYNSAVHTEITGPSPVASGAESTDSPALDNESGTDGSEDSDDDGYSEAEGAHLRTGRKQSVVSVSTTISTKTEAISPQPTLRPQTSRGSTESEEESEEEEDLEAQLKELGPPPFLRGLLLLAQMSSADNFLTPQYTAACVRHARANKDFVIGFIAQQSLNTERDDNFITMTPGVQLSAGGDALGQQYNTPRKVVLEGGSDIIIVGRGVIGSPDKRKMAMEYRKQGWLAYEQRLRTERPSTREED